jgi:hypothetical protein
MTFSINIVWHIIILIFAIVKHCKFRGCQSYLRKCTARIFKELILLWRRDIENDNSENLALTFETPRGKKPLPNSS